MIRISSGAGPLLAIHCFLQGIKLLAHPELRKYLLIPLLINLVLYTAAFVLSYYSVSGLIEHLIPAWLSWLSWILWPLFFLSFIVVSFFTFTLMANLVAAPYYSQLATKTWQLLNGKPLETSEEPWNKVFLAELTRIRYLLVRALPLFILFWVPVVNVVAPVLWGVFAAWGIAMEFLAYPLEIKGLLFAKQKQFLQERRWSVLSFGGLVGLGLSLPVVNLLVGQAAVIGATLYIYQLSPDRHTTYES
jgi:CysZ protein